MNRRNDGQGAHIQIVDDDEDILRLLTLRLQARGFRVTPAHSAEEALAQIAVDPPRVVVSDIRLPGRDGLALFEELRRTRPTLPVILLTAHGTIPDAVDATSRGVFGYLTKPFDSQTLLEKIDQALALSATASENQAPAVEKWQEGVVYRSTRMAELMAEARMVAMSDASVLIRGESGTGKEVMARAIHRASPRAEGPFVAINCGAIPEQLLESELFGHVRGAFTGAEKDREGVFEYASGGTLFLDEIGDMPMELQGRLLRVLQERSFSRLGGARQIVFDARVVAATHRRLESLVAEGRFREDLYYRIKGVRVSLPALRERDDRAALIDALMAREAGDGEVPSLSPEARHVLMHYRWPGNIRQLGHVLRLALTLAEGEAEIGLQHLPEELLTDLDEAPAPRAMPSRGSEVCLRDIELEAVRAAMARNAGNVSATARSLGVARATLYRKLKLLGLA